MEQIAAELLAIKECLIVIAVTLGLMYFTKNMHGK